MPGRTQHRLSAPAVVLLAIAAVLSLTTQAHAMAPKVIDGPINDPVLLDGPWQFHLGDDAAWAAASLDDSRWEQITADRPWGKQTHPNYAGFAWYRRSIAIAPQPGAPPRLVLLVPHVDNAYEVYWNGVRVGQDGRLPPDPVYYESTQRPRTFDLGPAQSGVLAFRVWKAPLLTEDSGQGGGFRSAPTIGSPQAIATSLTLMDYKWLRSRQFYLGLNLLYGMVALLSLIGWLRDRDRWPLFWMAGFALAPILEMVLYGVRLPWTLVLANCLWQPVSAFRDISLWFLLLWLLELREDRTIVRLTVVCAWVDFGATVLDSLPYLLDWIPGWTVSMQIADAVFTAAWIPTTVLPLVLVVFAVLKHKRLDPARWLLAFLAFLTGMIQAAGSLAPQGSRFTHWTLADHIDAPLFTLDGNSISILTLASTLLLIAIVYAVYRNFDEDRRRQTAMQQEFKSARELQQALIPEILPALPGYALTSVYRPAQEVGGDFILIVPLEGDASGAALVVLGDVSGKGLKAALAVSFIVGAVRVLANLVPGPAQLLVELNRRLCGQLHGGFATCLVLLVDSRGRCVVATAGHPPPFVNGMELDLPGAFPLGLVPTTAYDEAAIQFHPGDHCTLYTDGLLEARSQTGELFGFERLSKLLASRPSAAQSAEAAIQFGQDDDITIVTLTRVPDPAASTSRPAAGAA